MGIGDKKFKKITKKSVRSAVSKRCGNSLFVNIVEIAAQRYTACKLAYRNVIAFCKSGNV